MSIYNLVSFVGIFILLGLAWLFSSNRRNVNYRVILWAIVLQFIFAAFVFLIPAGAKFFLYLNGLVVSVLDSASAGAEFLFGRLALPPGTQNENGESSLGFFL
ncbi:MAG: Na+ dependent nucleoside transporter N-terminal domain-containing protein, partial [Thermodesulfobacteriota bacterium]